MNENVVGITQYKEIQNIYKSRYILRKSTINKINNNSFIFILQ